MQSSVYYQVKEKMCVSSMNEMQSNGQEPFAMRSIANSENDGQKF